MLNTLSKCGSDDEKLKAKSSDDEKVKANMRDREYVPESPKSKHNRGQSEDMRVANLRTPKPTAKASRRRELRG